MVFEFMHTVGVAPSQQSLDVLLSKTRQLRVFGGGSVVDRLLRDELLYQTDEGRVISTLREAMRVVDGNFGHCMCYGDPTLELSDALGARLALISIHHGFSIRWRGWETDAKLVDGRGLMEWLATQGVTGPLAQYKEEQQREEAERQEWIRWSKLAPSCLQPLELRNPDLDAMRDALEAHYPGGPQRALVLLEWYGSGTSPWWRMCFAYEEIPGDLLKTIAPKDLIAAAATATLSDSQLEGAARLFATWRYGSSPRSRPLQLPGLVKFRVLEHMLRSTDPDKQACARRAFGPASE
ncbi:MAG TPA: hypothetical protein VFU71_23115 [Burkholderiaceae bacterium]|nr:hypothetical protein [Burkholderiaceae bacterium]